MNENVADGKMQTQVQQMSKKNKVVVPFYSPPCRLNGHTSADIIKEAREAVMTTSPIGIKPVFTNRPFTPIQKERTLFGNVKKSKSRPPSSFSLRNLKTPEPNSRVKLPSIEIASRKNNYSISHYSKNLSLDNLTEDYDAEIFEQVKSSEAENLPTWKKPQSCLKKGRLSKVSSLSDIHHSFLDPNNCVKEKLEDGEIEEQNLYNFSSNVSKLFGDSINLEQNENQYEKVQQNLIMTKGGGDYEVFSNKEFLTDKMDLESEAKESLSIGNTDPLKSNQIEGEMIEVKEVIELSATKKNVEEDSLEKLENTKRKLVEIRKEQNNSKENKDICKSENFAEKSMVTGSKSEYLISLKSGYESTNTAKYSHPVPLELLELYETARYYGVDVGQTDKKKSTLDASSKKPVEITEKLNSNIKLEENLKTFDKMQKNDTSENLLLSQNAALTNKQIKITPKGDPDEFVEFVMNNKKRYHMVCDKGNVREKAYKKWNNKLETNTVSSKPDVSNDSWDLFWKNSYYKGKDTKEVTSKKDADWKSLQCLINKISELNKKGANDLDIYQSVSQLYDLIKNNKIVLNSKLKESITKSLYLYVDSENAELLMSLAKVFFIMKEENLLSVACKIIFKVARFDTNDHLFLNEEDILDLFLEGIGRASPLDCAESCVYSYGALKFLTLNHSILSRILHQGALDLMTLHLKMINNAYAENNYVGEQTQHALFQLTGALRNIAAGEGALSLFLTTNCISIICDSLRYFYKDEDVIINISRTLSLLSTDEIVTRALMQVENMLATLIDLIERYKENDKILIRLAFCLGNIVEHSDLARVQLSRNDAALTVLLNVLKVYIDKDLDISLRKENSLNPDTLSLEVVDDVIVKIIRIIANMSMNPIVGSNLSPATKEKKSLELSKLLSLLLIRKDPGITLLATLGCLNNISYYCNTHSMLIDITQGVERVLGLDSVECQIEAARVLGNLTRHKEIRDLIYSTGGVDLLIKLLSSSDQEVVRCACGALVNMMLDSETRNFFAKAQGIDKLVKVLEVFPGDWSLASLAARAIWNCCGDDMSSAVSHNNVEHLLNFLASSLEEENWNDGDVAWEEFASVATDLLEKISSHLEST